MNDLDDIRLNKVSFAFLEIIGHRREWTPTQKPRTVTTSGAVNALDDLVRVDATAGAVTMTLETAIGCDGRSHTFKKIDATGNNMTLACTGGQTIDGAATKVTAVQWTSFTVKSTGSNWEII